MGGQASNGAGKGEGSLEAGRTCLQWRQDCCSSAAKAEHLAPQCFRDESMAT